MKERLYVDMHAIQTVPPSCVNRDDTGSPKTAVYGGVRRARVSSQSWKRAMRECFRDSFDESELGTRTKKIVDMVAAEIVKKDSSVSMSDACTKAKDIIELAGVKTKEAKNSEVAEARALFFMAKKQAENLAILALSNEKVGKKEAQAALSNKHSIDIALFGRMVADDPSLNEDASAQVAHSISTHRVDNEYDYYTAVDEKSPEDNAGAGMVGTIEFNSSTLYRYATIAVHDLFGQLAKDCEATAKAVREFARAFAVSMPAGKQNTFANRTLPDAMFISVRTDQPVNLAAAFESPLCADAGMGGYAVRSAERLAEYEKEVCSTFASPPIVTWQVGKGLISLGNTADLQTALEELEQYIRES
ncbi:MAG: type I-E CRISPR-associated protein Cas7/Cse4/CasC [Candidatus Methanoplasma sp.]|nr:type I-E CRISPR-associated protein Cas7/Cse4/CasC [Candidatus Methanoplasma sp.]